MSLWLGTGTKVVVSLLVGVYNRVITCTRRGSGAQVDEHFCDLRQKPAMYGSACNNQACPPRYLLFFSLPGCLVVVFFSLAIFTFCYCFLLILSVFPCLQECMKITPLQTIQQVISPFLKPSMFLKTFHFKNVVYFCNYCFFFCFFFIFFHKAELQ